MQAKRLAAALVSVLALSGLAAAQSNSVKLFYTANARGYIDQCGCRYNPAGGIARRAAFLNASADSAMPQVVFDGGEVLGYQSASEELKTRYLFRAMQAMGYRVIGVGPHDLGYGLEFLRQAEREHGFTFVSANVIDARTRRPIFPAYAIEQAGDRRIGIISVIGYDRTPSTTHNDVRPALADAASAVSEAVAAMGDSADLVVVSAYVNSATLDTIKAIDGVDVVLVSRPMRLPDSRWVQTDARPVVGFQTYQGKGVTWMRLDLDRDGDIRDVRGDLLLLTAEVPDDPAMAALKAEYEQAAEALESAHQ